MSRRFIVSDFYAEVRWCPACKHDVHYLKGLDRSDRIDCGHVVRPFKDRSAIRTELGLNPRMMSGSATPAANTLSLR